MQIQVNTDRHVQNDERLAEFVRTTVESELSRFAERITRVEVHLSDENSGLKGGDADMRCLMEARLNGRPPLAVTEKSGTVEQSVVGAAEKLKRAIQSTLERLQDR
jgi:ribosome-associated translation inhibitor RaiA